MGDAELEKSFEQIRIDQEAQHKAYLESEENKQNALYLASQLEQLMGKNWFTLDSYARKSGFTREIAFFKLNLCKDFGKALQKIESFAVKGKARYEKKPVFKITISVEDRIKGLDDIIAYHHSEIAKIELQKKSLLS